MWDPQSRVLAGAARVDHPGHGAEPVASVRDVRDLARHVLARVPADRFSFVGLSLGGAVGMQLSLDAPERLEKLVLACTAARFGEPEEWRERAALVRAQGLESVVDTVLERWFSPGFRDVQTFREMFLSTDAEGYARCCDALAGWDVRGELAAVRVPTLAIAGADDPSTPSELLEQLAAEIPDSRLVTIADGRHLVNVERADEFNEAILAFL